VRLEHAAELGDFQMSLLYLNDKGNYLQTHYFRTKYFNHVFVHKEGKFRPGSDQS
jgi:hypothetical protein